MGTIKERKIETLSGGAHIRQRLGMYLAAEQTDALRLALRELWVNSCDELTYKKRKGTVTIEIDKQNKKITVTDTGDGIPVEKVPDAFLTVNTGSNFSDRESNLIGANGIGVKAVTHSAKKVTVRTRTGEFIFEDGGTESILTSSKTNLDHFSGVRVEFTPLESIYGDSWINLDDLCSEIDEAAKFYPAITFVVNGKTIAYPQGLRLTNTEAYYEKGNVIVSLSLSKGQIRPFGNRLYLPQGGAFFTQFKTQLTKQINDTIDFKITGNELQEVFSGYVAVFVKEPLFSNQSKTSLANKEVNPEITEAVRNIVADLQKNKNWNKLVKQLETEVKAEEAAEKAREKIKRAREEITKGTKKKIVIGDKLKDCILSGEEAWLAICEGNSAQGSLNLGRNEENVATFPIRGKFINLLKNTQDKYLGNEELQQICQILGCDIFEKYNSKKLKYGRVLIAVDADADGMNIATLLITFFYVAMPELIKEGRLYWMKAPLYIRGNEYIFTEDEWNKITNKNGFKRCKGIGEMNPGEIKTSLFGEKKRWEQLKPKNWEKFSKLIEELMGTEVEDRRERLFKEVDFTQIKHM